MNQSSPCRIRSEQTSQPVPGVQWGPAPGLTGLWVWELVSSLQCTASCSSAFFLPRKLESSFPVVCGVVSYPRTGAVIGSVVKTQARLLSYPASNGRLPNWFLLQKVGSFYKEVKKKKKILGPLFIILLAINLVHVRNHLYYRLQVGRGPQKFL